MVKERFVETYSQGVTNVRKISNFNNADSHRETSGSATAPYYLETQKMPPGRRKIPLSGGAAFVTRNQRTV